MKRGTLPSISILTISYNPNIVVFQRSLESIKKQKYQGSIEHIVVDGGSQKNIIQLAKQYGCKLIIKRNLRDQSEARRSFAVHAAKNDIILWLETDNILQDIDTLTKLTQPFVDDSTIISTYPMHYGYNKAGSLLDRYAALFGTSDPVAMYLRKTDREPWFCKSYSKGKLINSTKRYDVVEFDDHTLPTVGDNGFLTRRKVLLQARVSPKEYVHIDIYVDLLRLGYKRFAIVKGTSIEHVIGNNLMKLVTRRMIYAYRYSVSSYLTNRRYLVFNSDSLRDKLNLFKYVAFTVTVIEPLIEGIRGFFVIRDIAWFYHPIVCWVFLIYYMKNTYRSILRLKLQ